VQVVGGVAASLQGAQQVIAAHIDWPEERPWPIINKYKDRLIVLFF